MAEREDVAWAAGIYEGEGTCGPYVTGGGGFKLSVRMSDEDIIDRLLTVFPFGIKRIHTEPSRPRVLYGFHVARAEYVQAFLAAVWPWLGNRRRERAAEALLAIRAHPNGGRLANGELRCRTRDLKGRFAHV